MAGWTEAEDAQLRAGYAEGTRVAVLARKMRRTSASILSRAKRLGIKHCAFGQGNPGSRKWTEADDAYLRQHCADASDAEIGAALGRTTEAVRIRRSILGGTRASRSYHTSVIRRPKGISSDQIAWARENWPHPEAVAIARLVAGRAA